MGLYSCFKTVNGSTTAARLAGRYAAIRAGTERAETETASRTVNARCATAEEAPALLPRHRRELPTVGLDRRGRRTGRFREAKRGWAATERTGEPRKRETAALPRTLRPSAYREGGG